MNRIIIVISTCAAVSALAACGDSSGDPMDGSTPGADGSTPSGMDGSIPPGTDGSVTPPPSDGSVWAPLPDGGCAMVTCQEHLYECGNCIDDDGDGLADWADPDCLGPCDNNEGGFFLGIPGGDAQPCALDCYFDQDEGFGNDDCTWDHRCDPLGPDPDPLCRPQDPPPIQAMCPSTQSTMCQDFCGPLVPNGCDCFGCCELPAGSGEYVFIGSTDGAGTPTCTLDDVGDSERCRPCTPVADCLNDCGRCELCLGRTTLPADCFDTPSDGGTTEARCPDGVQACGLPGDPACPTNYYCITGCCQVFE